LKKASGDTSYPLGGTEDRKRRRKKTTFLNKGRYHPLLEGDYHDL